MVCTFGSCLTFSRPDQRQRKTEPLVLDDSRVADSLVLREGPIGKRDTLPTHLYAAVWEVVKIDVLPSETISHLAGFQDDLLALIRDAELLADVTLLAVAEDLVQPASSNVERSVQILRPSGCTAKCSL